MSRRQRRAEHAKRSGGPPPERVPVPDRVRYLGFALIGAFAVVLVLLVTQSGLRAAETAVGFVAAMLALVHLYGFKAYRGAELDPWQQSLARLPLRWAGFGNRNGRPLQAAKGSPEARNVLLLSLVLSVAIVIALAAAVVR
jgi:protein-S-isoprenylcysteine O-methyltransferase Ste14